MLISKKICVSNRDELKFAQIISFQTDCEHIEKIHFRTKKCKKSDTSEVEIGM